MAVALAPLLASALPYAIENAPMAIEMIKKYAPIGGKIANTLFSKSGRKSIKKFIKNRSSPGGMMKIFSKDIPNVMSAIQNVDSISSDMKKLGFDKQADILNKAGNVANSLYSDFYKKPYNNLDIYAHKNTPIDNEQE